MSKTTEEDNELKIVVLYCQHTVAEGSGVAEAADGAVGLAVKTVLLPCSSKLQVAELLRIIDEEADGVEIVACPESQCRFLVGSRLAEKRVKYACELLGRINVPGECLGISRQSGISAEELMSLASARAEAVRSVSKKRGVS